MTRVQPNLFGLPLNNFGKYPVLKDTVDMEVEFRITIMTSGKMKGPTAILTSIIKGQ